MKKLSSYALVHSSPMKEMKKAAQMVTKISLLNTFIVGIVRYTHLNSKIRTMRMKIAGCVMIVRMIGV